MIKAWKVTDGCGRLGRRRSRVRDATTELGVDERDDGHSNQGEGRRASASPDHHLGWMCDGMPVCWDVYGHVKSKSEAGLAIIEG